MPGAKEAELKARRLRSAALLTSGLASVGKADSRIPGSPDREQAGTSTQSGSKNRIREDIIIEGDVLKLADVLLAVFLHNKHERGQVKSSKMTAKKEMIGG